METENSAPNTLESVTVLETESAAAPETEAMETEVTATVVTDEVSVEASKEGGETIQDSEMQEPETETATATDNQGDTEPVSTEQSAEPLSTEQSSAPTLTTATLNATTNEDAVEEEQVVDFERSSSKDSGIIEVDYEDAEQASEEPDATGTSAAKSDPKKLANGVSDQKVDEKAKKEAENKEKEEDEVLPENFTPYGEDRVHFPVEDATLNAHIAGNTLIPDSRNSLQVLNMGARLNTGIVGGRTFFEFRLVSKLTPSQQADEIFASKDTRDAGMRAAKEVARIGLTTADGDVLMTKHGEDCMFFDLKSSEIRVPGKANGIRTTDHKKDRWDAVGILVNLLEGHANQNTVSVFRNGKRIASPVPIPEQLRGKPLFPTVTLRLLTGEMNISS